MQQVGPLPRPTAAAIITALLTCAAAAWLFTVARADSMGVGGLVIILAGIYQFTPLKDVCLRTCRTPLSFILGHDFGSGPASAVRTGAVHGLYCLGCCWALMAILAVLGLMNIAWMAVFAAIFFIEKNVRFGDLLPRAVGLASIVGGLAIAAWPVYLAPAAM